MASRARRSSAWSATASWRRSTLISASSRVSTAPPTCSSGDYKEALVYGRRSAKANPQFINGYKPLIASLGHLGELDEARTYLDKVLDLEPKFTVKQFGLTYPFSNDVDRDRYCDGLRLAGVPEG